jgi:hypothetical protein
MSKFANVSTQWFHDRRCVRRLGALGIEVEILFVRSAKRLKRRARARYRGQRYENSPTLLTIHLYNYSAVHLRPLLI